jgi:salicylate hydroxylase
MIELGPPSLHPRELPTFHSELLFSDTETTMDGPTRRILIIGAGLCGLGAAISIALEGHQVVVFESAPQLHQVGAGIQISPNGSRLLKRWGVSEELEQSAVAPEFLSILRYDGRSLLAHRSSYREEIRNNYGEPLWCLHRVDLQKSLARRAQELGVRLLFDTRISHVDFDESTVIYENGCKEKGDLVIAADGLWSSTRSSFLQKPSKPQPTGDLAYRVVIAADQVDDDELRAVIAKPGIRIWMGPGAHVVAYSVFGGRLLNVVLLVPDDLPQDVAKARGDPGEMAKRFEGWDPL